ncbi:MAG: hypothetical protein ACOX6Q_01465 [Candidatus Dojkabacteria bacterium]|jgi:hypothetical protein
MMEKSSSCERNQSNSNSTGNTLEEIQTSTRSEEHDDYLEKLKKDFGEKKTQDSPERELSDPTFENALANALKEAKLPEDISNLSEENKSLYESEYLKEDKYGFAPKIDKEIFNEIASHQKSFEKVCLSLMSNYIVPNGEFSDVDEKNPFFFSPRTLDIISNKVILPLIKDLEKILGNVDAEQGKEYSWKEMHISGILNKLIAFESFKMSRIMSTRARKHIEKYFNDGDTIRVKEYCTGAGINTALLCKSLERTGKKIQIHTVDNAIESVACSAGLLSSIGIPVRIVLDSSEDETDFNGVTIFFDTAMHFAQRESKSKYHIIATDCGLNYLDENADILRKTKEYLVENGLVQISTLDPKVEAKMSKIKVLSTLFFGNLPKMFKKNHKENKIYDLDKGKRESGEEISIITQVFTAATSLQYHLLQYLLRNDRHLFKIYLKGSQTSGDLSRALSKKIIVDLRDSEAVLKELYPDGKYTYLPSYEEQPVYLIRVLELNTAKENE